MVQILAALKDDRARRIVLQHLLYACPEMVMERRPFPDTHMLSAFLIELIHLRLQYDRYALHEKNTAQQGYHEFLAGHVAGPGLNAYATMPIDAVTF